MKPNGDKVQMVVVRPLTQEAFKPFGEVTAIDQGSRRNPLPGAFERTIDAIEPRLWVATVTSAATLPMTLRTLERHPYSAQTFLPLNAPYLVVVCESDQAGEPDVGTLQAFHATAQQGVTYARNVWHHGLTVLESPGRFVVSMSFTGTGGDDIFVPLDLPVQLVAAAA